MLYKQGGAGSTAVMEVTVTFKDIEIESLTETITSNITISLDFAQEGNNVDTTTKYLVTYDSQGGNTIESRYVTWNEYSMASPVDPIKTGYVFGGWFSGRYGSGEKALGAIPASQFMNSESDEGFTLYAYWTPKRYKIIYNKQGAGNNATSTYGWDNTNLVYSQNPRKTGYALNGWYTSPNGGGLKIKGNTKVSDIVEYVYGKYTDVAGGTKGDEVTIYANWIPKIYTINFYSRGGSAIPDMTGLTWNQTITLPTPTKEGYTFGGWYSDYDESYTDEDFDDDYLVESGVEITPAEFFWNDNDYYPMELYAKWIPNS